jgi:predicted ATPase
MREQGRVREAHDLLAPVYGSFTEGFVTKHLKEAKALLHELGERALQGTVEDAAAALVGRSG